MCVLFDVRCGPQTVVESTDWAAKSLHSLSNEMLLQFLDKFQNGGVTIYTDYSGIGSGEESFRQLCRAAEKMLSAGRVMAGRARAADIDINCRGILAAGALDATNPPSAEDMCFTPSCVLGDIRERCPSPLWKRLVDTQAKHLKRAEQKPCPVLPPFSADAHTPKLTGCIAGVCCQDWSHMGKRLQ